MTWTCSLDSRNTRTGLRSSHTLSFVERYCFRCSIHGIRFLACSSLRPCHHCFGSEIGASFVVFGRLRKVTTAAVLAWSCFWPRDVVNYLAKCVFEFVVGSGHLRCAVSVPVSLFLSLSLWAGAGSGAEAGTLKSLPNRRDLVLCVSTRIAQEGWLLCTWIPLPVLPLATCGNCWWCALTTCG